MATRVTENEVKQVINTELTASEVTPFVRTANVIVNEVLADEGYSDDRLREIELYLAAHFIAVREGRPASQKIGEAQITYHGKSALGLQHTPQGQQVMLLDDHGRLAQAASTKIAFEVKTIA